MKMTEISTDSADAVLEDIDWNDAEYVGPEPEGFSDFLEKPATLLVGELWGAKDRRNTQDGHWKAVTQRWGDWIEGGAGNGNQKAWGFSRHPEGKHKEGASIVLGSSIDGARKAAAMDEMSALGLDIDSGASIDAVVAKIESMGLFALIYTSHSHGKSGLQIKRDDVLRKLGIDTDPTLPQIQEYLRTHSKSRYDEKFISQARIENGKLQTTEGVKIALSTPPLDKFRIIFPLAENVKLIDLAPTQQAALEVWEDKITGMAWEALGVHFDTSCTDPSRLFFTARHAKDSEWGCYVVRGKPLRFEDVPTMKKSDYTRSRGGAVSQQKRFYTESGVDLNSWYNDNAESLQFADFIETVAPDKVRGEPASGVKEIECPFDHEHSNAGDADDRACIVVDALDAKGGRGTISCRHDSCQGRGNAEYLAEMLDKRWCTEAQLFETDGMHILDAGEEGTASAVQGKAATADAVQDDEFEPVADWLPSSRYMVKGEAIYTKDDTPVPICAKFDVVGRSSNEDGTAGAGRIISFVNENNIRVETTIFRADVMGDGNAVMRDLADRGLVIFGRGKAATDRVLNLLNEIAPQRQIPTVNVPGWVRDEHGDIAGFMHPTGVYDRVSGPQFRLLEGSRVEVVKPKGSVEGWTTGAKEVLSYAGTNFYWPLGLAAGFAGPLLGILEWQPCGFSLSGLTSKGKTMAQLMGASIWGSPQPGRGVLFTANTTGNAMEDLSVRGTDSFLALDEIGAMSDKRALSGILFALSTGRTKSRKEGRGRGLAQGDNFRPFTVLTSEKGMRNEIQAAGDSYRGGLAVRFPDIDVSDGENISGDALERLSICADNYGHAGRVFIRHLIDAKIDRATLEKEIIAIAEKLAGANSSAMGRAARVFAVSQRAGELAADAGLLGDVEAAKAAVQTAVARAWDTFTQSDEAGAATGGDALLDKLRSFLFGELNRRIIIMDAQVEVSDGHANARGDVLGWADSNVIYLDSSKVQDPASLGLDIGSRNELTKQLAKLGVLIQPEGKGATFRQLPKELAPGSENGAAVRNIRLCRKTLEI